MAERASHWETVYQTKAFDGVSWFAPHLHESLDLIGRLAGGPHAAIIDVGGGESTLIDDLMGRGFEDLSVLDISGAAIAFTQQRLADQAHRVSWHVGDVTQYAFAPHQFDIWHDRAVFHFLTDVASREAYVRQVRSAVKPGGHVIMATFGPEGPTQCSGLDVMRYGASQLHAEFGDDFKLLGSKTDDHRTPFNTNQQFLYCWCRVG